ncbi:Hypothetical predicted protein [Paramuricea clavata]|uniref:Uncharacterized protein n=1 Tax=Paramuricea clavata TaxID=317549 RepID=A0A6S7FHM2_PARCT|nr:Hypothetical predicted protein [Paramuricea clavata]
MPSALTPERAVKEIANIYIKSDKEKGLKAHILPVIQSAVRGNRTDPVLTELKVTELEVETLLNSLDTNKATGSDEIPARLLKETASIITPSICKLFNKSLQQGTVPQDWKLANVVPVYKKGDKEYTENYRPISLLPIISKVLERYIFMNIRQHFSGIIYDHQHGFLQGKSCVTNLLEALDYIGAANFETVDGRAHH